MKLKELRQYNEGKKVKSAAYNLGLAQAGQWLARELVQICKFCARPSGSESPACAKPLLVICNFADSTAER